MFLNQEKEANYYWAHFTEKKLGGGPRSVVATVLDCDILGNKFELYLRYYVYFWTNTLGNGISPLIFPRLVI